MSRNVPAREECQQKLEALQEVHKEDRHQWLGIVDSLIGELVEVARVQHPLGTRRANVGAQREAARAALSAEARAALDRQLWDATGEGDAAAIERLAAEGGLIAGEPVVGTATPGAKSGGGRRKSKKNKSKKKRSKKRKSKKRKTKRIKKIR